MRILLDACVPRKLGRQLVGLDVTTARRAGFQSLDDRKLLDMMEGRFDVLVTLDRSLPSQQRIADRPLAVIALRARSSKPADLLPLVPALLGALAAVQPGEVREIGGAGPAGS